MIIKDYYHCSLHLAIDLIGGKWKPAILWHLRKGPLRFTEIQKKLRGVSQKSLTLQLREMEAAGLVSRCVYPVVPPKVEYKLTDQSIPVLPILLELYNWAHQYAHDCAIEVKPKADPSIDIHKLFAH